MDLSEAPAFLHRRHPWEVARLDFFRRQLSARGFDRRPVAILDVGSGDAWFARSLLPALDPATRVTCWDAAYTPAQMEALAREAGLRLTCVSAPPEGRFDLVLLLDVLEHIEDDAGFLAGVVARNLAPGAHALVSVPAWGALFGAHDVQLRHFRRYAPSAGARLVRGAGLSIGPRGCAETSSSRSPATGTWISCSWTTARPTPPPSGWRPWSAAPGARRRSCVSNATKARPRPSAAVSSARSSRGPGSSGTRTPISRPRPTSWPGWWARRGAGGSRWGWGRAGGCS